MSRTAVILFNLGGPDSQEAVQPFLFNLFNDSNIIRIPQPFRYLLAKFIARKRKNYAKEIYQQIGGGSPILKNTLAQAEALQNQLGVGYRVFTCMRYWHPRAMEVLRSVQSYNPEEIILLPLYPQFSTTTTYSSLYEWGLLSQKTTSRATTKTIGCYPLNPSWIKANVLLLRRALVRMGQQKYRILFSAHGLPQSIIDSGDPYQWQVEKTANRIIQCLGTMKYDWRVCYQSRVGFQRWIKPFIDDEIMRAGQDGTSVIILPLSFVSEHSETLVELDITYRKLAKKSGVPNFIRVPTVGSNSIFIEGLVNMIKGGSNSCHEKMLNQEICPKIFNQCYCRSHELVN